MSQNITAAQLKDEGRSLFLKKEYDKAATKYSEALQHDNSNAILYCNRAACHLTLQRWEEAARDAQKATDIDPNYSKAWARLAAAYDALNRTPMNAEAWQKALDSLPEKLGAEEARQKEQYQAALNKAKSRFETRGNDEHPPRPEGPPWVLAEALKSKLTAEGKSDAFLQSSGNVILFAYSEFVEGDEKMKLQRQRSYRQSRDEVRTAISGMTGVIVHLSNAIMNDYRAALEAQEVGAWTKVDSRVVIQESPRRLSTQGWNSLRKALSISVRLWILGGHLDAGIQGKHFTNVKTLRHVLDVLEWGRTTWKDVPSVDRGVIFNDTFVRGVRSMLLQAMLSSYIPGSYSHASLKSLLKEADIVLLDLQEHPHDASKPLLAFDYCFYVYPASRAYSIKGFYHREKADSMKGSRAAKEHHRKAADFYLKAGYMLPDDDESHTWFLHCALMNLWGCSAPLRETLPVMEAIQVSVPKMRSIWANSWQGLQGNRDKSLDPEVEMVPMLKEKLAAGKLNLDFCFRM